MGHGEFTADSKINNTATLIIVTGHCELSHAVFYAIVYK